MVYPQKKLGIVFAPANDKGEVGVQIQKRKIFVSHRRLRLHVSAEKMYPPDYDFFILFDTWKTGKHVMRWKENMCRDWKSGMRNETEGRANERRKNLLHRQ